MAFFCFLSPSALSSSSCSNSNHFFSYITIHFSSSNKFDSPSYVFPHCSFQTEHRIHFVLLPAGRHPAVPLFPFPISNLSSPHTHFPLHRRRMDLCSQQHCWPDACSLTILSPPPRIIYLHSFLTSSLHHPPTAFLLFLFTLFFASPPSSSGCPPAERERERDLSKFAEEAGAKRMRRRGRKIKKKPTAKKSQNSHMK